MNEYESVRIINLLKSHGYKDASSSNDASVVILNTCTVRKKAEDKVYSALGRIKKIKKKSPGMIICVGGCLAQQEGRTLLNKFPYVDIVFGTKALNRLPSLLDMAKKGERVVDVEMISLNDIYPTESYLSEKDNLTAFISIMQGCNNHCSYCIVPVVRGPEWSRYPNVIIDEVQDLADQGVKEITLLGQNVNSYGKTLKPVTNISELLFSLNKISALQRIRFVTSHPRDLSEKLIKSMRDIHKVCEHIHLPIQSGSDRVLKMMNRHYTTEQYIRQIDLLREAVPNISITSDIIVGFPGETEKDFNDTLSVVKNLCFDDLFVFHYTDRPGTKATNLPLKLPYQTRIQRLRMLSEIQMEISRNKNRELIGRTLPVLFEGISKKGSGEIYGRTRTNKVVNCRGPIELTGLILPVKIDGANIHSLNGKIERGILND